MSLLLLLAALPSLAWAQPVDTAPAEAGDEPTVVPAERAVPIETTT